MSGAKTTSAPANAFENYDLKGEAPGARDPRVRFAFEFPELLATFKPIDNKAMIARKASRRSGILAVPDGHFATVVTSDHQIISLKESPAVPTLGIVPL